MISLGYGVQKGFRKIEINQGEIEVIEGPAGAGKSVGLVRLLKEFDKNAVMFLESGVSEKYLYNCDVMYLNSKNYDLEINTLEDRIRKNKVVIISNDIDSQWINNVKNNVVEVIRDYFRREMCGGFLAIDGFIIDENLLSDILDTGTNIKVAVQNASGYENIYKSRGEIVKTICGPSCDTNSYSGNISLRLPKSLHEKLSLAASYEGVSLNQYIMYSLSLNLGR